MAMIKVLRTSGDAGEIFDNAEIKPVYLFIMSLDKVETNKHDSEHELGDIIKRGSDESKFALIVKERINTKINIPALRVSIISLLKYLVENDIKPESILIPVHQFNNSKEENSFIATLKEFCMTYFGEILTDDITLVISNYRDDSMCDCNDIFKSYNNKNDEE